MMTNDEASSSSSIFTNSDEDYNTINFGVADNEPFLVLFLI